MPTCPDHPAVELMPVKRGWYCEECDRSVLSYEDAPRPGAPADTGSPEAAARGGDVDPGSLPFPVAHPLAYSASGDLSPGERLDNALFAAYQSMRLTAVILLADHLSRGEPVPELAGPIRGLQMPHWREWTVLCDRLCGYWLGHFPGSRPSSPTRFPTLVEGWREVNRRRRPSRGPWVPLLEGLGGLEGPARSAHDALWRARNDRAHRQGTRTPDRARDAARLATLRSVASQVSATLFPPTEIALWVREEGEPNRARRLVGAWPRGGGVEDVGDRGPLFDRSALLAVGPGGAVPLHPLAVPVFEGEADEPACMIDGATRRRVTVLGVRDSFVLPELGPQFADLASGARVELGAGWSHARRDGLAAYTALTAAEQLAEVRGSSYLPEVYLARPRVDDLVDQAVDRPGRGLLVLGEPGSGKSSLLARLAERRLAAGDGERPGRGRGSGGDVDRYLRRNGAGDAVLFVTGRHLTGDASRDARSLLCEALMERAGVRSGVFDDLNHFADRLGETAGADPRVDRRVWIVIDGLDEAPRFADLVRAVDAFLPSLTRHPWLRLAVSMRSGAHAALVRRRYELAARGGEAFVNHRLWHHFAHPDSGEEVPYLEVPPFDELEVREAYVRRQRGWPDRSSRLSYGDLSPELRQLVRSPLQLHLFHETFRGSDAEPRALDGDRLLDTYLDRLKRDLPAAGKTLAWIGELLYRRRRSSLPLASAEERAAAWRARLGFNSAARVAKLDPIEELVAAGVLERREGGGGEEGAFVFAQRRLCERVLVDELGRRSEGAPDAATLARWIHHVSAVEVGFPALESALEEIVARRVEAGDGATVASLLDLDEVRTCRGLLVAAIRALGPVGSRGPRGHAPAVLEALRRSASQELDRAARFEPAARAGRDWLETAGYGAAARAVDEARLSLLLAAAKRSPASRESRLAVARVRHDLAIRDLRSGDLPGARAGLDEALRVLRELAGGSPSDGDLRRDVSVVLNRLADLDRARGDRAGAENRLAESTEIMRGAIAEGGGGALAPDLAITLAQRADLAVESREPDRAGAWMTEALEVVESACEMAPDRAELRQDRAVALSAAARIEALRGYGARARALAGEAIGALEELVADEPHRADRRHQLAVALSGTAVLDARNGDVEAARDRFDGAVRQLERLSAAEPSRGDLLAELALARRNQAALYSGAERRARIEQAVAALESLRALGPLSDEAEALWARIEGDDA